MKHPFSIIVKNFSFLLASSIVSKVALAFATVYLARVLGPRYYGIIGFSQAFAVYFNLLTDLGLKTTALRELSRVDDRISYQNVIFATKLSLTLLAVILYILASYLLPIDAETRPVLLLYVVSTFLSGILIDWVYMAAEKMKYVAIAESIKTALYVILLLTLVSKSTHTIRIPVAYAIAMSISSCYLLLNLKRMRLSLKPKWCFVDIYQTLRLTIPLGAAQIFITLYYYSDQLLLGFLKSKEVVGYYSAPYKIINFGVLFLNLIISSSIPFLTRLLNRNQDLYERIVNFLGRVSLFIAFPVGMAITLYSKNIILILFGEEYVNSVVVLQVIVWSLVAIGIRFVFENYLIISGSQKSYLKYTAMYFCVNMILNLILIPRFGALGAAIATLGADITFTLFLFIVLPRNFFLGYMTTFVLMWVTTIAALLLSHYQGQRNGFIMFASLAAFVTIGIGSYYNERERIAKLVYEVRNTLILDR